MVKIVVSGPQGCGKSQAIQIIYDALLKANVTSCWIVEKQTR